LFDKGVFPQSIAFAQEAFDTGPPDAINLWIGDERSVSSMHKDHYENLFHVLHGEKLFTLCPPADVPFLHEGDFESGTFSSKSHHNNRHEPHTCEWSVVSDHDKHTSNESNNEETVKWIEPDIERFMAESNHDNGNNNGEYGKRFPWMHHAHPIQVRVKAGEMLYLPALWFHRVTQTCETVGINYWYDMKFDSPNWCYFNFLQQFKRAKEETPINNNK
jgi:jumonji domain-containing protein 7